MIPFTGVGLYKGYRGDEWFKERIEVFKKTTLKSLANQNNQQFVLWLTFRPEEFENPLVDEISKAVQAEGLQFIMTFDGLMYTDDKFVGGFKNRYANARRVWRTSRRLKKPWREVVGNVAELFKNKNGDLVERLERSLAFIADAVHTSDLVLLTRLDSDDMLHEDAVEAIQQAIHMPSVEAVLLRKGYILNTDTGELAEWNPTTNPPFFTLVFATKTFLNPLYHFFHWRGYQSHEDVEKSFKHVVIQGQRLYCVGVRNPKNHISTTWEHPFRGRNIGIGKRRILKTFGQGA